MNIEYNQVTNIIDKRFPDFIIDKENIELVYIIAGDFSRYLLKCYKSKDMDELQNGLDFIEELHIFGDHKTKEIATIGFLEGIQNVWGNSGTNPEKIYDLLGKESKKYWNELNIFWRNVGDWKKKELFKIN